MPSQAKNKKKDDGPTWDDEQAIRVLHHELETAATRAFRHPKIDPSAVYFSVLLGKKRSDSGAHERTRPGLSSMLIPSLLIPSLSSSLRRTAIGCSPGGSDQHYPFGAPHHGHVQKIEGYEEGGGATER